MTEDIVARLRCRTLMENHGHGDVRDVPDEECIEAADEIERLRDFVSWLDAWIRNPVGAFSVYALNWLFSAARERIAALSLPSKEQEP